MKIQSYIQQFQEAILAKEFEKAEAVLLSADCKKEIIKEYIQNNSVDKLHTILPAFKSRGLVKTIEDMIDNNL